MDLLYQKYSDVITRESGSGRSKKSGVPLRSGNPLMQIPIAQRLILGFLLPALIAALIAGIIGVQSAQLLSQESTFYQNLFQSYSSLTTSNNFLQLMDFKINATINDALLPSPHLEQLKLDRQAVQGLEQKHDALLKDYVQHDLLLYHPEQISLFEASGHLGLPGQQSVLAHSAERTWQLYHSTLEQILQDIQDKQYQNAQTLQQSQGALTYTDALSALRQLILFDGRLTTYVQDATTIQQRNELVTTATAVLILLLAIGIMGWLIYGTLVNRLHHLRTVAQAVQKGRTDTRAMVDGRDEITDVSASINSMLDTIIGLFEETRVQHNALVSAAERLFSDMRIANDGEIDVRKAANDDPIGMLGNAFNFTVGRFRRFVLRNQTVIQQLEHLSQGGSERADKFLVKVRDLLGSTHSARTTPPRSSSGNFGATASRFESSQQHESGKPSNTPQVKIIRDQLQHIKHQDIENNGNAVLSLVEQSLRHFHYAATEMRNTRSTPIAMQELSSLETLIRQIGRETQSFQQIAMRHLTEIDTNLSSLSPGASLPLSPKPASGLSPVQIQELARLTESFAQETITLTQALNKITHDMRTSLAPFRLETTSVQ